MIKFDSAIILDDVVLSPELSSIYDQYVALSKIGKVGENHTRLADFRRWQIAYQLMIKSTNHLDIGCGVGQFANLLKKNNSQCNVAACDVSRSWRLQNIFGFKYVDFDLKNSLDEIYDTVSCLEVIEHIENDFDNAVLNLKKIVGKQLLLSVPFSEKLPLGPGHFQVFTKQRLEKLFPNSKYYFCLNKNICQWVLIDWRPAI